MAETLKERIIRHITLSGPLPLAEYIHWCMADSLQGYYVSKDVIGRSGDFITAPEISQMFGELIGAWTVHVWEQMGKPATVNLVEIGPGYGTLMSDVLRATGQADDFVEAANTHLIETSPRMIERQHEALDNSASWYKSISSIDSHPSIVFANEFLDVLPFRQYVKSGEKWMERCVGLDETGNLIWLLSNNAIDDASLPIGHESEPDGAVFEISTVRESHIATVAELISKSRGAALYIDYGHLKSGFGDTFQALRQHSQVDPLSDPGSADLTSHVDFDAIRSVVGNLGVTCHPFMTQGEFLLALGLLERAGKLGTGKSAEEQAVITRQAERLALPDQMGSLFKVFCFSSFQTLWPFDLN